MNRFEWTDGSFLNDETLVRKIDGVSLSDGPKMSGFIGGCALLTTHRLLWHDIKDSSYRIGLHLKVVKLVKLEKGSFGKPNSIQITFFDNNNDNDFAHKETLQSPVSNSIYDMIKLFFKNSGDNEFYNSLSETLNAKCWVINNERQRSKGILGIERSIQKRSKATDKNIEVAFADLDQLMDKAKEMMAICRQISQKINEKGEMNTDETVQFKSYLLSMGIADPVTRKSCTNSQKYVEKLAEEINDFLSKILPKVGGVMSSTDAFCRINRARGMELLSPEDLIEAGNLMNRKKKAVLFKIFDSGVMFFQLASMTDDKSIEETVKIVTDNGSLSAEKLSRIIHIPTMLSKERLLLCENRGKLCRDDTVEGLLFYPNKFL